jgi:hypothetical protein
VFLTNSHCTSDYASNQNRLFYQGGQFVGTEVAHPPLFTGGVCPAGRQCRWSDAAMVAYDPNVSWAFAQSAWTGLPFCTSTPCGVNIAGNMTIVQHYPVLAPEGTTLNKIGQRTGWTRGNVTQSCADQNGDPQASLGGITPLNLCQTFVRSRQ